MNENAMNKRRVRFYERV